MSENDEDHSYIMKETDESAEEDACAVALQTYDKYDRAIRSEYFDKNGNPATGAEGLSVITREYTSRGSVSMEKYFSPDGQPTTKEGAYAVSRDYNSYGNLDLESYLDQNGDPVMIDAGYAATKFDYDLSNSRVQKYFRYYLDQAGESCAAANGAWGMSILYYPVTRVYEVTFLDQNNKPMTTDEGYAILEYEVDENDHRVWEAYYDDIHAPIECAAGYSSVERGFDSQGRLVSERYLDRYNKLTNNAQGVAGWNGYYDSEGNLVITGRYDKDRNNLPTDNQ